ncbi:MAG: hypothetical protein GX814_00015, partial [Microbacteriaceae bacterium]|nr:hypothetical protein [Microbacteriaceae bacterium]
FVHGVLNTDNVTISGETIDYGPCAFLDAYDPATVFSSIDQAGHYAYGNQAGITLWNLNRIAESLLPLLSGGDAASALESNPADEQSETGDGQGDSGATSDVDDALERAKSRALAALAHYGPAYGRAWLAGTRAKLGLAGESHPHVTDDTILKLASEMLASLREHRVDYTSFFRALAEAVRGNREPLTELFSLTPLRDVTRDELVTGVPGTWLDRWLELTPDADAMNLVNPIYIPRNELLDEALDAASAGDLEPFRRMLALVSAPFTPASGAERFEHPEFVGIRRHITYCGT